MKLHSILKDLMESAKLSESELSRRIGIPQPMIHRLLKQQNQNPKLATLKPIADYFLLTISQLIGEQPLPQRSEGAWIQEQHLDSRRLPILPWDLAALEVPTRAIGTGDRVLVSSQIGPNAFALEQQDSSMSPKFQAGTLLIICPEQAILPGDFAIVYFQNSGKLALRQIWEQQGLKCTKAFNCTEEPDCYPLQHGDRLLGRLLESRSPFLSFNPQQNQA